MKERRLYISLVNYIPNLLSSMKREQDINRISFISRRLVDEYGIGEWLNCFNTRAQNRCLVSISNSPYACFNIVTQKVATANCTLKVNHNRDGQKFSLEAITIINAHDEILWSYGADYEYPDRYMHV